MKKSIKLALIFIGILTAVIVGSISVYSLINNNKTYYIYDLRIVEPVSNSKSYIYTNAASENTYKSIKTKYVNLKNLEENFLEIAIYANTSDGSANVNVWSEDETIAKIVYKNNKCYVNYLKPGETNIYTSIGSVTDNFKLCVYEYIPINLKIYDFDYYGENYAKRDQYINKIVCYAEQDNELTYKYKYELFDEMNNLNNESFNNSLLEIDENSFDKNYFKNISINSQEKTITLTCQKITDLNSSIHTTIAVKNYIMVDGEKYYKNIYPIDVSIIINEIEFYQIEVSTNPDFTNNTVLVNINETKYSDNLTESELISYLTCQRVENKLEMNNENILYDLYCSDNVNTFYLKFRIVYTNGDVKELKLDDLGQNFTLKIDDKNLINSGEYAHLNVTNDGINYLESDPLGEFFELHLTKDYMFSLTNATSKITLGLIGDYASSYLNDDAKLKAFKIKYLNLSKINDLTKIYMQNDDGTYSFNYWDNRMIVNNVVYDENGNITQFIFEE